MRKSVLLAAFTAFVCVGLPLMLLPEGGRDLESTSQTGSGQMQQAQEVPGIDGAIGIRVRTDDGVAEMPLDEYLVGVLLGEMPMDFSEEALKAQAVVCRTYTLRRIGAPKHEDADICMDSSCCQAWSDGEGYPESARMKAQSAIKATDGEVLLYRGTLIDATFFSSSGGRTESAVEVWGTDVPYLQAVDSPGEDSPYNVDQKRFSLHDFRSLILEASPEAKLDGAPESWFGQYQRSAGGGISSIWIGGVSFSGTELRRLLSLRSTAFDVEVTAEEIIFHTQGFGHRVGMSQYGAQALALAGWSYRDILLYYYTDVECGVYQQ